MTWRHKEISKDKEEETERQEPSAIDAQTKTQSRNTFSFFLLNTHSPLNVCFVFEVVKLFSLTSLSNPFYEVGAKKPLMPELPPQKDIFQNYFFFSRSSSVYLSVGMSVFVCITPVFLNSLSFRSM